MMARKSVIGLFKGVDEAADALDAVRAGGFERRVRDTHRNALS